jgi:succinate dehydrogenase / fumarate reductase cytochrome b subunit
VSKDLDVRPRAGTSLGRLWGSTIGKKAVMAVTGLVLVGYLLAHMIGNLKVFLGADAMNDYAAWLRTLGEPALPYSVFLWILRVILIVAVVLHIVAAAQLTVRDHRARPVRYQSRRRVLAPGTMRWGGATLAVFVVWHLLDLTVGVANRDYVAGDPYHNVVADFSVWWVNAIYLVAMLMLGLHLDHGIAGAARTLGFGDPRIRAVSRTTAIVIAGGFAVVPLGVMIGLVK